MKAFLSALFRLPKNLLIATVKAYRLLLSPSLGSACRFEPSCSVYSLQALEQRGAVVGTCLTLHRLVRCHPWCDGGYDPLSKREAPNRHKANIFTRLVKPVTSISSEKNPS
ncbi:MAG: hypothetical protein JWP47_2388 [Polaromonas sp.]|jgi:putative membrane protein insertion efficiency factor|nr:hypothetical protein [Polaromonas sp.]